MHWEKISKLARDGDKGSNWENTKRIAYRILRFADIDGNFAPSTEKDDDGLYVKHREARIQHPAPKKKQKEIEIAGMKIELLPPEGQVKYL